jgi:hypothetical protein
MPPFHSSKSLVSLFLGAAVMTPLGYAGSPVQCKTLSREACSTHPGCTWVAGYVRKDGRQVKAYCRTVSRKANKEAAGSGAKRPGEKAGTAVGTH